MSVNFDFEEILSIFNERNVRALIVGGYAVMRYTEPRYTKDLDIWVQASAENARAVFEGLKEFGAPLSNLAASDFAQEGHFYQMGVPPVRVDILMSVNGLEFDPAWSRRVEVDFDALPVPFLSRADLILSKRAAGRPQDLVDLDALSSTGD
jgi:Nucleotidyltransferase of unknown function (DUF6036)